MYKYHLRIWITQHYSSRGLLRCDAVWCHNAGDLDLKHHRRVGLKTQKVTG